ncbi:pyrimidine (deoxy)nucleoside triphosphate diphosphatase [Edaphovirga cremea]|uniref:pyrimidine (deoxy)nucleoside triphosphate diphosphatase n=1 Tax=Edaphovirga cremea TaxID=2267246 RepID=UPI000DEFFED8|nr:pyrimidine (deoxy)nucleoside triphosphate diphosphatase [Edaphovirga cremea]
MKIVDVVAAVIERDGLIMLAQRDNSRDQAGLWEFPGGKVEAGESQQDALSRELEEELAIRTRVVSFIAHSDLQLSDKVVRLYAWRVTILNGEPVCRCHSAVVWVMPEAAREYGLAPADIPLLEAYILSCRAAERP